MTVTVHPSRPHVVDRMASIVPVPVPELGNTSYVVVGARGAAVIDPPRDVRAVLAATEHHGASVAIVVETHVHEDHVSGAHELRAATGAPIAAPAGGGYAFEHRALADGDEIRMGGIGLRAIATPGHTPEHVSYLVIRDGADRPDAVLTGGGLLVGAVGRSDLLGLVHLDDLTRAQFRSLARLRRLPSDTVVLPTHGATRSDGVGEASSMPRVTTIGEELAWNAAFAEDDECAFVAERRRGRCSPPRSFRSIAEANRRGAPPLPGADLPRDLSPADVAARAAEGAWVIDARDRGAFASGHIPGSIWNPLDASFIAHLGSLVPFGAPLLLVTSSPERDHVQEALRSARAIGYGPVLGYLAGGLAAWRASGRPVARLATYGPDRRTGDDDAPLVPLVLDVRSPCEWERPSRPDVLRIPMTELLARVAQIPSDRSIVTACSDGRRATVAASLLRRLGFAAGALVDGGLRDLPFPDGASVAEAAPPSAAHLASA